MNEFTYKEQTGQKLSKPICLIFLTLINLGMNLPTSPLAYGIGTEFLFMQHNAKPHTAAITMNFLGEHEVRTIECPALRLDFNSITYRTSMGYLRQA